MITLKNLSLQRGTKLIFERVNLTIYAGQKVGVVGANGCGKSTLFALFLDEIHPDAGDLELPPRITIAHVAQETPAPASRKFTRSSFMQMAIVPTPAPHAC